MIIGRQSELSLINKAIGSRKAELGIVYGRRRIGKSTLLRQPFQSSRDLYFEALQKTSAPKQIAHFLAQFAEQTKQARFVAGD